MATHTITCRDWDEDDVKRRRIIWNDETGEVSGDHSKVPGLRRALAHAARGGRLHLLIEGGYLDPRDPLHDPADFLALMLFPYVNRSDLLDLDLPPALRGIEPTPMRSPGPPPPGAVY